MRVIVSGGSGLIGRALVDGLAADGHQTTVLSRSLDRLRDLPAGVRAAPWDARSAEMLTPLVAGADAVVHLAGEGIASGRWSAERKRRIRDSRVDSSAAMAAAIALAEPRPSVLLQASAVGFYGSRGSEELTEESAPGDDFLAETCRQWEAASAAVEDLGVRRVVLRTGLVLARDGGALPRMQLPFRLFAGGPLGNGRQYMPWIHLDDEVGAIRFLLDSPTAGGPFNLTAPEPLTNKQFSRTLGRVLRRPSFMPAPAVALRLALGEMSKLLLEGQRALPRRLEEAGYRFRYPGLETALRDLVLPA
jgi:uncharacterized protein (TIGR01777 family)